MELVLEKQQLVKGGGSCLKKLLGKRARWVWRSSWELGRAKHRTVKGWRRGVMRLACRFMDQVNKEKVPAAELIWLVGLSLLLLWR